ncbi:MAG: hypothetical protein AAGP08_03545 [Pseudomonadota bacterium]
MAEVIFGDSLDADQVRVKSGFRGAPPVTDPPLPAKRAVEPRPGACDRTAPTPREGPPPAWALYNTVHFSKDFYRNDHAPGWPGDILLPQSFIMAHELVHVWQWQNRATTGYRPVKAGLESVLNMDPYFYVPDEGAGFLEYGFEQQASLLEDYMCYAVFDPANPRRAKTRTILAPYFEMDRFDVALAR